VQSNRIVCGSLPDLGHLFAGLQVALGLHEATHDAQGATEILAVLALSRSGMVWESAIKTGVKKTSDPDGSSM
jgi:hypothetical protein